MLVLQNVELHSLKFPNAPAGTSGCGVSSTGGKVPKPEQIMTIYNAQYAML